MSDKYSSFERRIASFLHQYPSLKRWIKTAYQYLNYHLYKKNIPYQCSYPIKKISFGNEESFFGYYDKTPVNETGTHLIFHSNLFPSTNKPVAHNKLNIYLLNLNNDKNDLIGETCAWNWQQGSRLQWLDRNRFVFNDFDKSKNSYVAHIYNIQDKKFEKHLDFPVYDAKNEISISLNFERLSLLSPDYGYFATDVKNYDHLPPLGNDGIFKTQISGNKTVLVHDFNTIISAHYQSSMEHAQHLVNHIMISPDGNWFIFIHRWFNKGIIYHGLMISDMEGRSVKCIIDNIMISHCTWFGNQKIICFMEYNGQAGYYTIDIKSQQIFPVKIQYIEQIGDGHPSIYNHLMVTDSYPDKRRNKNLYLVDLQDGKIDMVGQFLEPLKYHEETRCDLHPCWNNNGKKIFVNSVHEGRRFLYQIELTKNG